MKIAIIGSAYPYRGGIAIYNERLARAFMDAGHEVEVFTFTLQYPSFLFPGKSQYSEDEAPKDLKINRCVNSVNPLNWIASGNKIKRFNADLVIVKFWLPFMGPAYGTILRRIRKNKHSKIITIIDNMIPHESRPGDKAFSTYFTKAVHGFVAMSKTVLKDISIFDTQKPRILSPHPLYDSFGDPIAKNMAREKLGLEKDAKILLFFGLIRDYKGLDLLIESFADPRFRKDKYHLIIAGEYYSDKHVYTSLIEKHDLNNFVLQADKFIPDSEVSLYFSAADLVVQPYKSATQSGVTQIAYHFNKPMVVTKVGGLPEMCPDGKVGYVTEVDPKSIADGVLRFFENDPNSQKQMAENINELKKQYSWEILVENITKLKEKIEA